ncbi:uncharacterized protein LOC142332369 isoform X2 [Lycorma delicatula]|uniref:uncharacterized protein LOC142332369 isoform X2 n=1 Tax=Lycorma delicatula TaxID=130591 RepID=UPI003F515DBD
MTVFIFIYRIKTAYKNLYFFPSASRMIIHNSWMCMNPIIKPVKYIDNDNRKNSAVPYYSVLPLSLSTPDLEDVKQCGTLSKIQDNEDPNDVTLEVSFEMYNSLFTLPVLYTSGDNLQVTRKMTNLDSNWYDVNELKHQILTLSCKMKQKNTGLNENEIIDDSTKMVKVLKKSIENTELKPKFSSNSAGDITEAKKKNKTKVSSGINISWAQIEKRLPFWQNIIADILQKLQDIVTRRR